MTREDLVKQLQEEGFTFREARSVVAIIIDEMKQALARGEEVHLPFGIIKPVRNKRAVRLWALKKIVVKHRNKFRFLFKQIWPWK